MFRTNELLWIWWQLAAYLFLLRDTLWLVLSRHERQYKTYGFIPVSKTITIINSRNTLKLCFSLADPAVKDRKQNAMGAYIWAWSYYGYDTAKELSSYLTREDKSFTPLVCWTTQLIQCVPIKKNFKIVPFHDNIWKYAHLECRRAWSQIAT